MANPQAAAPGTSGKTLSIGSLQLGSDILLAPLSGITDVPFRRLVRRFGAGLVFSEMIASGEYLKGTEESLTRAMADGAGLHAVQLAGRDPLAMEASARQLADLGADLIDINLGCPAKKVVGGLCGSALMREPDLALRLIEAVVRGAGEVPVTVKMRLGWDRSSINAPTIASRAESAGIRMVTVHGRTRQDLYAGAADWPAIAAVKQAVSIPVVANGDLVEAHDAARMRRDSGADALMVGRGSCGRPWFLALLAGQVEKAVLARENFAELVVGHYEAMLTHYGEQKGLRHARKHLGWYLDRAEAALSADLSEDRRALLGSIEPAAVTRQLRSLLGAASLFDVEFSGSDRRVAA